MRRRAVGVTCALLLCLSGFASLSFADGEYSVTKSSEDFGVSPTGTIGPKSAGIVPRVPPPAPPASTGAIVPPAPTTYPTFTGFFDEEGETPPVVVEEPVVPVEGPMVEGPTVVEPPPVYLPISGDGEIYEGVPYSGPVVALPPPAPLPLAAAPRLERRVAPSDCSADCGQRRDDCCWPVDDCGERYGCTTVTLEGSFGLLTDPTGVLGTPAFGVANQFDWNEIDYEGAIGGRITLEHAMAPQQWLQVRGAYYGSWRGTVARVGVLGFQPGNTFTGGGTQPVGATIATPGTLTSTADMYGAEINYADELSCSGCTRWDFLLGIRYLQFNEGATAGFAAAPIVGFTGPAFAASSVENTFIGLQIGGRWHYQPSDNFEITASLKVLGGNVNRTLAVSDQSIFAGGPHAATSEEDEVVWGADVEIGMRLRLTSNIGVTLGYNMVLLDKIVRANDAMDFSASGSGAVQATQNTDQLIWHGVVAGLQFNF